MSRQILQISHDFNGPFVSVCRQYVDAFPGDTVITVFLRGSENADVIAGVGGEQVIFLEEPGEDLRGIKISQILRLYGLIKHQPFDLVVAHRYKAIYLAGIMSYFLPLSRLLGIAHEHDVFKRVTRKLFVTFWRRRYLIAGVSDSVTNNIAQYCPSLIQENRLFSLPNVLPKNHQAKILTRLKAREALGIEPDALIVGTIGRLVEKKSLHTLVEAFSQLNGLTATLVIIGDGPKMSDLQQLAEKLNLSDRVCFLGHVRNAGLLVAAFDLFVLPSGIEEAFGIVLLEAMMAKVPVLSSDAPGPKQVVGASGRLFATGDVLDLAKHMQEILEWSDSKRAALGEAGFVRVQSEYTHEKFRSRLDKLPLFEPM